MSSDIMRASLQPFLMRLPQTLPSKLLSPAVENLVGTFLSFVPDRRRYTYPELEEIAIRCPMAAAAIDVRIHLTLSAMGDYQHEEEEIAAEMNSSIGMMGGSWADKLADVLGFLPYGFSFTETAYRNFGSGAALAGLQTLNQSRCRFEGKSGAIESVLYVDITGKETKIPYVSGLHLKNQAHLLLNSSDPRGISILERMRPYYEAYNLMLAAIVLASQRQATPILVQKTNISSTLPLLDASGRPMLNVDGTPMLISAGQQAKDALEQVENSSVLVIDRLDELEAIAQQTDGKLLLSAIDFILGMIAQCALVPRSLLLTNAGGVGDSTLAEAQTAVFRQIIERDVSKLSGGLIEYCFKPVLKWNHGEMDDYGSFAVNEEKMGSAAQLIGAIATAVSQGALAGFESDAANRIKELAGIGG
jgi:hypothetical protein